MSTPEHTLQTISDHGGWVGWHDLHVLARSDHTRLTPILVRCGGCRFTAPAQDVTTIVNALTAAGDYLRDMSLPVQPPNPSNRPNPPKGKFATLGR